MTNEDKQPIFPYVAYPTFKAFIGHLHDTVVTDQIDNTMMPHRMSGAGRSGVTSALKSLGLIDDDNNTSPKLKELVTACDGKDWQTAVKKHILSAYDSIAGGIELKSATRKQLEGIFEGASAGMKDKYIRFFLSANKDAGIEYSPHLKIRRRLPKKRVVKLSAKVDASGNQPPKPPEEPPKDERTPSDMYDLNIPGVPGSFIRVPVNVTVKQIALVKAAVTFIELMAEQNKESE